jgi:ribose 5-phosphate isomerase B
MIISIGCDHAGYKLKEALKQYLEEKNINVIDFGTNGTESVDYPDFARPAAEYVKDQKANFGILICYTGIGMCIAANKVRGVRASLVHLVEDAILTREHNNSNVLCLSAKNTTIDDSIKIVEAYLNSSFTEGRHLQRVEKVCKIEDEERKSL